MHPCILDAAGEKLLHRNMRNDRAYFLKLIAPYREGLVVAAESTYNWYRLADLCAEEQIEFVLGHAYYMKSIHGSKTKNDRIDSEKLARLLRGGMFPRSYVYPTGMRETRDLLRRRTAFVRRRAAHYTHIQHLNSQQLLPSIGRGAKYKRDRAALPEHFPREAQTTRSFRSIFLLYCTHSESVEHALLPDLSGLCCRVLYYRSAFSARPCVCVFPTRGSAASQTSTQLQ